MDVLISNYNFPPPAAQGKAGEDVQPHFSWSCSALLYVEFYHVMGNTLHVQWQNPAVFKQEKKAFTMFSLVTASRALLLNTQVIGFIEQH